MLTRHAIASQEVHDRALFYYRLLKANPNVARDVVLAGSDAVMKGQAGVPGSGSNVANGFAEDHEVLSKDVLFEEFNSLSVIYGKSERLFIAFDKCPRKPEPSTASAAAAHAATPMPPMPPGAASLSGDLLGDAAAPPPPAAAVAAMAHAPAVSLLPDF